jgi:DNA invertase Pin-like site-specific DNA recombinase
MLLEIVEQLTEKGASFKSLEEPWADTTSATGRLVMTFFAGMAEYAERALMQSHTAEVALNRCSSGVVLRIIPTQTARKLARLVS